MEKTDINPINTAPKIGDYITAYSIFSPQANCKVHTQHLSNVKVDPSYLHVKWNNLLY